eukprot:COSAG06_NODE_2011_length_7849_cov_3.030581_4_plen_156_part_00
MWGFKNWLETEAPDDLKDWPGADFPVPQDRFVDLLKMWLAGMKKAENSRSDPKKFLPHEDYKDMLWIEDNTVMAASSSTRPPNPQLPTLMPPALQQLQLREPLLLSHPPLFSLLFAFVFLLLLLPCWDKTADALASMLRYARSGPGQYHSWSMGR